MVLGLNKCYLFRSFYEKVKETMRLTFIGKRRLTENYKYACKIPILIKVTNQVMPTGCLICEFPDVYILFLRMQK